MSSTRLSKRELALVAAALLVPVPLIAESGLSLPVPGAVQRGFGSLITLDANDDNSGTTTTGSISANSAGRQSRHVALSIARTHRSTRSTAVSRGNGAGRAGGSAGGQGGSDSPDTATAKGGGDTDDTGSSGDSGGTDRPRSPGATDTPRGDAGRAPQSEPDRMPSVGVRVAGQGTASGVSVGADDIDAEVGAEPRDASDHTADVRVDATDPAGSQTGAGIGVSGTGVSLH